MKNNKNKCDEILNSLNVIKEIDNVGLHEIQESKTKSIYPNEENKEISKIKIEIKSNDNDNNTDDNINTDDSNSNLNENIFGNTYDFSISSLNRELKKINRLPSPHFINRFLKKTNNKTYKKDSSNSLNNKLDDITLQSDTLIKNKLKEIRLRIIGHDRAANMYERYIKYLAFPIMMFSVAITATTTASTAENSIMNQSVLHYLSFSFSIISLFLNSISNLLNLPSKYQSHDLSHKLYTNLHRSVEMELIEDLDNINKRNIFKDIISQMSIIEQYETTIPYRIYNKIEKENEILENS